MCIRSLYSIPLLVLEKGNDKTEKVFNQKREAYNKKQREKVERVGVCSLFELLLLICWEKK